MDSKRYEGMATTWFGPVVDEPKQKRGLDVALSLSLSLSHGHSDFFAHNRLFVVLPENIVALSPCQCFNRNPMAVR